MKNLLLLITIFSFCFTTVYSQETPMPLQDKSVNEFIPEAPTSYHVWVKGHYEFKSGKYYWIDGSYVLGVENHSWVDGEWVLNQKTGMFTYKDGYWKNNEGTIVYNGIAYEPGVVKKLSVVEMYSPEMYSSLSE